MKQNKPNPKPPVSRRPEAKPPQGSQVTSHESRVLGRCQFYSTDNRRCRMPRWHAHPVYCLDHARREQQILDLDRVGAELASLSGSFKTANDVNHALGKLFSVLAQNRIPHRNAAVLAYIAQLLLHSLPSVKHEIERAQGWDAWERTLREVFARHARALAAPAPPQSLNSPASNPES